MALRSISTLEGRVFLSGIPSPRFEIRVFRSLDELPTKATSLVNPEQIGFKAPTTRHCTTRISDKTTPRRERFWLGLDQQKLC